MQPKDHNALSLSFIYLPTVDDVVKILLNSIYPTIGFGDIRKQQDACINLLKNVGIPPITDNTMDSSYGGVSISLLHAFMKPYRKTCDKLTFSNGGCLIGNFNIDEFGNVTSLGNESPIASVICDRGYEVYCSNNASNIV